MIVKSIKAVVGLMLLATIIIISGCKIAVYHNLSEQDANQMLALLLSNNIAAAKQMGDKGEKATLVVEQSQLVKALRILQSNGYPKHQFATVDQIFPPGQLITSPEQQQIKMVYAQEQQLDHMLSNIPGVISSSVQLNENVNNDVSSLDAKPKPPTAAVLIVYSPQHNVDDYMVQVRSLIRNSVPGLTDQNLSVVMVPSTNLPTHIASLHQAMFANTSVSLEKSAPKSITGKPENTLEHLWVKDKVMLIASIILFLIFCLGLGILLYFILKYRVLLKQNKQTENASL